MLPFEVLEQAREELTDWRGGGMSVMEVSHRSKGFLAITQELEATLRELAGYPGKLQSSIPARRRNGAICCGTAQSRQGLLGS
jgi:hypothetical protein